MYIYIYIYAYMYMYVYNVSLSLYIYIYTHGAGTRDSPHHHLLKVVSETATVLELERALRYTTPCRWCIKPLFRGVVFDH